LGSSGSPDIRIKNYRGTELSRKNLANSPTSKGSRRGINSKLEERDNGGFSAMTDQYNPL